ncbi:MAG: amidoligase family protein [Gammaproteobacteria bacterium]
MQMPPETISHNGGVRRCGVEIEFAGLAIETAVACVTALFGGTVVSENRFVARVDDTRSGDFVVELDASFLQDQGYREFLGGLCIDIDALAWRRPLEDLLVELSAVVVPLEVCTPPLPLHELPLVEKLIRCLRERGAQGTGQSFLYAFGMQLNPEAAALDAGYILRMLQAYLVIARDDDPRAAIDLTRRLSPFVRPFSRAFVAHFTDPDYAPDQATLIDDYLRLNPTRNRPLDLLPLLAHLDRARVLASADEPHLVKPRPAFHYRLPDCHIDRPAWRFDEAWSGWLAIERLATDRAALATALRGRG